MPVRVYMTPTALDMVESTPCGFRQNLMESPPGPSLMSVLEVQEYLPVLNKTPAHPRNLSQAPDGELPDLVVVVVVVVEF